MRLSNSSFAGTARTLVAVGMVSDTSMFLAMAAAAPRSGLVSSPSLPVSVLAGAGFLASGWGAVLGALLGSAFGAVLGSVFGAGCFTGAAVLAAGRCPLFDAVSGAVAARPVDVVFATVSVFALLEASVVTRWVGL